MTADPEWLTKEDVLLFHGQLIAAFGGADGTRDEGLLESALGRPRHVRAYETDDLVELAATYAHAIARNHPFVDGNKRTAFVVVRVFLGLNDVAFDPPEEEAVVMMEALATGELTRNEFASWVRKYAK